MGSELEFWKVAQAGKREGQGKETRRERKEDLPIAKLR